MCILIKSGFLQVKSLPDSFGEFITKELSMQIYLKALTTPEYFQNVRGSYCHSSDITFVQE